LPFLYKGPPLLKRKPVEMPLSTPFRLFYSRRGRDAPFFSSKIRKCNFSSFFGGGCIEVGSPAVPPSIFYSDCSPCAPPPLPSWSESDLHFFSLPSTPAPGSGRWCDIPCRFFSLNYFPLSLCLVAGYSYLFLFLESLRNKKQATFFSSSFPLHLSRASRFLSPLPSFS